MRYVLHDMIGVVATWQSQPRPPSTIFELEVLGEALAEMGDPAALPLIERLRAVEPAEADAILARLHLRRRRTTEAASALVAALVRYREDPWPDREVMRRALLDVGTSLSERREVAEWLFETLKQPFALRMLEYERLRVRVELASKINFDKLCVEVLAPYEPNVPWDDSLEKRARCYRKAGHPLAAQAERDLEELVDQEGRRLSTGIWPGKD
jgi:hypothetical protein